MVLGLVLALAVGAQTVADAHSTTMLEHVLYVSPPTRNNDTGWRDLQAAAVAAVAADGSPSAPFPTIEAARDHLRAVRANGALGNRRYRVVISAGTYPPLHLEKQDSGSPGRPIIYEADTSHGPVVVSGGIQVPKSAFQPWQGHPGVLKADLAQLGVIDYGSITAGGDCGGNCTGFAKAGLVFANRSMVLARWPNVDNVTGKYSWEMVKIGGSNGFSVNDPAVVARMTKWGAEADPWLHSYSKYDWSDTWNRINISASTSEINVTIVDHPPAGTMAASAEETASARHSGHTGTAHVHADGIAATGVWVIKITAQPGPGWSKPTVMCNGTADDVFRVLAVATGGPSDPLKGQCKQWHVDTQNILQVSSNNGSTWTLAHTNSTVPGALACGNDKQKIESAIFGPFCPAIGASKSHCLAQGSRCVWKNNHCADAPAPPPPPPPPPAPPPPGPSWWHPFSVGQAKYYGTNMLCELDAPNEWFIDEATDTLYFFPPVPLDQWTEGPYITQNLFSTNISGASHITLRGLGIHHSRGNGLVAANVNGVRVENCEISGHGQHGVVMNGTNSGVDSSRVYSVGCSGVRVSGGDPRTLTAGNCYVTSNHIANFSLWKRTYVPGIFWNGVSNNYSFNIVHNGPHNCILGGGNEGWPWGQTKTVAGDGSQCLFEGNSLDTCVYECGDCGAFYTCGQQGMAWVNRGNVLRNGTFTNIGSWSIYLDDQMSGWTIEDSTIDGASKGLLLGGGRRNRVLNNRFANVDTAVDLDDRGLGWESAMCKSTAPHSISSRVRELLYPGSPWLRQYPELLNITTDTPCAPAYCEVTGNRYEKSVKTFLTGGQETSWPSWHVIVANNSKA